MNDFDIPDNGTMKNIIEVMCGDTRTKLKDLIKIGNLKIGADTLIFNMGSAYKCPSDKLNLCKVSDKCYAKKAEDQYWLTATHYREKQAVYWKETPAGYIAQDLMDILENKNKTALHPIKYLRLNESGDFYSQKDIIKLLEIAKIIKIFYPDFTIYTYTARSDLDYSQTKFQDNLIINGSGFMIDNNFDIYTDKNVLSKDDKICKGDCRVCNYCKLKRNINIKVKLH